MSAILLLAFLAAAPDRSARCTELKDCQLAAETACKVSGQVPEITRTVGPGPTGWRIFFRCVTPV